MMFFLHDTSFIFQTQVMLYGTELDISPFSHINIYSLYFVKFFRKPPHPWGNRKTIRKKKHNHKAKAVSRRKRYLRYLS